MRISTIFTDSGAAGLVAFDQLPMVATSLQLDLTSDDQLLIYNQLMAQMVWDLSKHATGIVINPEDGFYTIINKANNAGLLLTLESRDVNLSPEAVPTFARNWSPEHIRNNYAVCKLELFYHPKEANALRKKKFVSEILDYCRYLGIDFVLELKFFKLNEEASESSQQEMKLWSISEFRTLCDILVLEPPLDPLSMATVTAELDIPWLYTSVTSSYEEFKNQMRMSLENGASGFIIGHSLWQELPDVKDGNFDEAFNFIRTIARDRLIELMRITKESKTLV